MCSIIVSVNIDITTHTASMIKLSALIINGTSSKPQLHISGIFFFLDRNIHPIPFLCYLVFIVCGYFNLRPSAFFIAWILSLSWTFGRRSSLNYSGLTCKYHCKLPVFDFVFVFVFVLNFIIACPLAPPLGYSVLACQWHCN